MHTTLSQDAINIIKGTARLVTVNDIKITTRMYQILFSKYPHMKKMFENAPKGQPMLLAESLSAYAMNIERLERLRPALLIIAKTHVRKEIQPGHYPMLGMVLLQAMEEVLGDQATVDFLDAWREAYKVIANMLIEMEKSLYLKKGLKII